MTTDVLTQVRQLLMENVDPAHLVTGSRFFKEAVKLYGVRSPMVRKIAKQTFAIIKDEPKDSIWALCAKLWLSGYMEECIVACHWAEYLHKRYAPADMDVFERWVDLYVTNWATCDTLCNHPVGMLVELYPVLLTRLQDWALSQNRWMRRAAAVSLIIPARRGLFLPEIFTIADLLLTDADDLVQKGYGWMLKAAGEAHQQDVFDYVLRQKAVMPRTALRYAIEKMPPNLRRQAMLK